MSFTLIKKSSSSSRCCALQTCQRRFSFQDPSQTKHCLFAVVTSHKMPFPLLKWCLRKDIPCLDDIFFLLVWVIFQPLRTQGNGFLMIRIRRCMLFLASSLSFFILPLNIMLSDSFSSVTDHMFYNWKCSPRAFGRNHCRRHFLLVDRPLWFNFILITTMGFVCSM